jgi:hypothetical protein
MATTTIKRRMQDGLKQKYPNYREARKVLRSREIKTLNVFLVARSELARRGWDKNCTTMKEANPCSFKTMIDFACLNILKTDDEFAARRKIVYDTLDECVAILTRQQVKSFTEWEHSRRTTSKKLNDLLSLCISESIKSFVG